MTKLSLAIAATLIGSAIAQTPAQPPKPLAWAYPVPDPSADGSREPESETSHRQRQSLHASPDRRPIQSARLVPQRTQSSAEPREERRPSASLRIVPLGCPATAIPNPATLSGLPVQYMLRHRWPTSKPVFVKTRKATSPPPEPRA